MGSQSQALLSDFHFQLCLLGFPEFSLEGLILEAEAPMLWPPDEKSLLLGKEPIVGKIEGRRTG